MNQDSYHILLLRHGESVGNKRGLLQGQADYPLSEKGRVQARALAQSWEENGRRFDRITASPLARARETAEIIAEPLGLTVNLDPIWKERDFGSWAGRELRDLSKTPPKRQYHPYQPLGETGESTFKLFLRAGQAVDSLVERPPGSYLVVSHGGLLNMALYTILGISPQTGKSGPRFNFGNCAYASLEYNPSWHQWRVLGVDVGLDRAPNAPAEIDSTTHGTPRQ